MSPGSREDYTEAVMGKKQQSLISQDWGMFGAICGLDEVHALSVFRCDY